jgi:drug/metabolite transporter (DMT)-like permease
MTQMLFTFALIPSVIFVSFTKNVRTGTNKPLGLFWGFISGIIAAAGNIAFYMALENGADTSIAIPLTNIYPLVTIFIAFLWFKERFHWIQAVGILLALIAITLLSGEAKNLGDPAAVISRIGLTPWMLYSLGAMVCWGVFSATQKVSTNHVSAELSYLAWCAAFVPIAIAIVIFKPLNWNMSQAMLWSGLAAGAFNSLGVIAAFAAYRYQGGAAIVTPLAAAVQPIVTIALAYLFLGERIGGLECIGIAVAIASAIALSFEAK